MPPLDLSRLGVGDSIQHELLVCERANKTTATGDPFVILTLGNSSGRMETAPIWSNQLDWVGGAERGTVVQVIGAISAYGKNGAVRRQVQLSGPVRVIPQELVDALDFLPAISEDRTRIWDWIDRARTDVRSPTLRRVLDLFFADDDFRVRFERTPASTAGHHAKIGGLLLHVYEVCSIARHTAKTMRANVDLVVTGALIHDIGKVEAYSVTPTGFAFTPSGHLVGHVVLGSLMLERTLCRLSPPCVESQILELHHFILSHHGSLEFGSPVRPATTEAEIVHWADETSAKANDMLESVGDAEGFLSGGEISDKKFWRVNRRVWRRPHGWE